MVERKLEFLNTLRKDDVLICTETSRLSRLLVELLSIVDDLLRRNKSIVFVRGSRGIRLGKPKGTIQCLINIKLRLKSGVDWDFHTQDRQGH